MSAHTAGPWTLVAQSDGSAMIAREFATGKQMNPKGLRLIAHVLARGNSLAEDEANARLIAAAPELLEALHGAVDNPTEDAYWILQARSAIAKATGETP